MVRQASTNTGEVLGPNGPYAAPSVISAPERKGKWNRLLHRDISIKQRITAIAGATALLVATVYGYDLHKRLKSEDPTIRAMSPLGAVIPFDSDKESLDKESVIHRMYRDVANEVLYARNQQPNSPTPEGR